MAEINWGLLDKNTPEKIANSFAEGQQNALARQNALQSQQLNALNLRKATREMAAEEQVRNALATSGGDIQKAMPDIMKVDPKTGLAYSKLIQEQRTAELTQQKAKIEGAQKSLEVVGQLLGNATDQASYSAALQQAKQFAPPGGLDHLPLQYDPVTVEQIRQKSMTVKQQLDQQLKLADHQLSIAKFGYQQQHDAQALGVQMRGQDMTDARGRDLAEAYRTKPFEGSVDGKPVLLQADKKGGVSVVDGFGPKVKGGEQSKVLPAQRIEELADMDQVRTALKEAGELAIKNNVSTGPIAGRIQSVGSKVGMASDDFVNVQQKLATAENIMLKLRSGAVVTEQEYKRFKNEYPTVNDTKEVRVRKLGNAVKYAEDLIDKKKAMYAEGGYKVPTSGGSGTQTVKPPPPTHPDYPEFSIVE